MIRRPPRFTRPSTLLPDTPLFRSVPSALRVLPAEFGMGSGVGPLARTTRSSKRPAHGLVVCDEVRKAAVLATPAAERQAGGLPLRAGSDQAERAISTGQLHALLQIGRAHV